MKNTALITGASGGIGRELARIHARRGKDVILVARSEEKLYRLKRELEAKYKIKAKVMVKDLSLATSPQEIYDEIKEENIEIEYLINNAGFGGQGYFHQRDWQKDADMIQVNMVTLSHLTRLFLPDFIARDKGKILNISSVAGEMPGPLQAVYFASKAYVTSFSNALSIELEKTKVTVTALLPAATDTGFAETSGLEGSGLFRFSNSANKVAKDGYKAMMEGKMKKVSGVHPIMMKLMKLIPKKIALRIVKKMQEVE